MTDREEMWRKVGLVFCFLTVYPILLSNLPFIIAYCWMVFALIAFFVSFGCFIVARMLAIKARKERAAALPFEQDSQGRKVKLL